MRQITERGEGREEQDERRKMREMRRRRKGKIPAAQKNGKVERLKEQGSGSWWRAKHIETDRAELVKKQH